VPALTILYATSDEPKLAVTVASQGVGTLLVGLACGMLRFATGSLLPSVALSSLVAGFGVAASALADRVPIPGFNAPGATTPLVYLIPAATSVALGVWLLTQQLAAAPALPPIPPRSREDDEEPGSLF
jgi:hypothetical protein